MADKSATLVIDTPSTEEIEVTAPAQVFRVERVLQAILPRVSGAIPAIRNGKQRITPEIKREISRIHIVKSAEEADSRYLSIDRTNRSAQLSGERFPLSWDRDSVGVDARLLLDYFKTMRAHSKEEWRASSTTTLR